MAAELQIRAGTAADTDPILALVKQSLGEGLIPRERAYWSWKHHENPFGESPILLAEADGDLVGLRVFMRWEWRAGRDTIRAVRAVDTATHPDWQGKGIFSRLTKALVQQVADAGVHLIFNTPNEKSRPGYLKMGWASVGRTDLWIRPLRPLRVARALAARTVGSGREAAAPPPEASGFQEVGDLVGHPGLRTFLQAIDAGAADAGLRTPLSPEYLRWRYQAIPGFRYHALFELDGGDGAAVVFRYKDQGPVAELRIAELMVGPGPGSGRIARSLLRRLHRESSVDYISAMSAAGTPERLALLRRAFLPALRLGPILTVRPLNPLPGGLDPLSREQWRLSIGDLELF